MGGLAATRTSGQAFAAPIPGRLTEPEPGMRPRSRPPDGAVRTTRPGPRGTWREANDWNVLGSIFCNFRRISPTLPLRRRRMMEPLG